MPSSSPNLPTNHTDKLFGIVYITLTGVIDTIILAAGPWSWVRKSVSYLFKLALLLWWALPAKNLAWVIPGNNRPAAQDWIPDSTTGAAAAQKRTITAFAVIVMSSLPCPLLSNSPSLGEFGITKIKE
ncbi:hypothetical protein DSO57_1039156, partial [Entomophthora muscae]